MPARMDELEGLVNTRRFHAARPLITSQMSVEAPMWLAALDALQYGAKEPQLALGLDSDSPLTVQRIRQAYKGRCLLVHPDKLKAKFGRQAFQCLAAAKDALLQQLDTGQSVEHRASGDDFPWWEPWDDESLKSKASASGAPFGEGAHGRCVCEASTARETSAQDSDHAHRTSDTTQHHASYMKKRSLGHNRGRDEPGTHPCDTSPRGVHHQETDAENDSAWLKGLETADLQEEVRLRQSRVMQALQRAASSMTHPSQDRESEPPTKVPKHADHQQVGAEDHATGLNPEEEDAVSSSLDDTAYYF